MKLLIIEDEEDLASALAKGLRQQGYAVDIALDGEEGEQLVEVHSYDVLILDLNLPGKDGLELLRTVRARQPHLFVLVITARGRTDQRVEGLDLGADDYLVKPFHLDELAARVRSVLRRDIRVREPILRCGPVALDPAAHIAWKEQRRLHLTRKEFAILEYLLRRRGDAVSQEEILEHIWGQESDHITNTVRVHIRALRRKLNGAPVGIETVIGQGYRLGMRHQEQEDLS